MNKQAVSSTVTLVLCGLGIGLIFFTTVDSILIGLQPDSGAVAGAIFLLGLLMTVAVANLLDDD